jgi:hypothetical protein
VTQTHSVHPSLQVSNHQIIQHEVLLNQAHLVTLALAYRSGSDGSSQNNRSKPISQTRLAAYTAPCMPKHSVAGLQSRDLDLAICRPYLFCRDSRGVRFLPSSNRVHMQRRANHAPPNIGATSQSIDRGFDLCCDSWVVNHTEFARGGLVALIIGASYVIEAVRSRIDLMWPTLGEH